MRANLYKRLIIISAITAIAATCARGTDTPSTVPPPNQATQIPQATTVVSAPTFTRAATSTPVPPATSAPTRAAASPTPSRTATIAEISGTVQARAKSSDAWTQATVGQSLPVGGQVQTLADGEVRLNVSPDNVVRLGQSSLFTLTALEGTNTQPKTLLTLIAGEIWVIVNAALNGGSFEVETPVGVAAVRGSYLGVDYDNVVESMIASCLEGLCNLRNALGTTDMGAEQETMIARRNQRPDAVRPMDPSRLERWQKFVRESQQFVNIAKTRLALTWLAPEFQATRDAVRTQVPERVKSSLLETAIAEKPEVGTRIALTLTRISTRLPPALATQVATRITLQPTRTPILVLPSRTPLLPSRTPTPQR